MSPPISRSALDRNNLLGLHSQSRLYKTIGILLMGGPEGSPTSPGASPHNELASTLGNELTLATGGRAKVFGVSFKDRAAILTSGHASRGAFWTDHDSGAWQTSTYWMQHLPDLAISFNAGGRAAQARKEAHVPSGTFYEGSDVHLLLSATNSTSQGLSSTESNWAETPKG